MYASLEENINRLQKQSLLRERNERHKLDRPVKRRKRVRGYVEDLVHETLVNDILQIGYWTTAARG